MSRAEQGVEGKVKYQYLIPLEGYPGFYTYKDLELDEAQVKSVIAQIPQFEVDKLKAEMLASGHGVDLGELRLVPLEGYPGMFRYRPVSTESLQTELVSP